MIIWFVCFYLKSVVAQNNKRNNYSVSNLKILIRHNNASSRNFKHQFFISVILLGQLNHYNYFQYMLVMEGLT